MGESKYSHLPRLEAEAYRGDAVVHWTMTIQNRKKGWLNRLFHSQFRELLTHTLGRYHISCPIYCCMPDHFHLLWQGLRAESDQRNAMKHLRTQLNRLLGQSDCKLQRQPFDHVLRDDERLDDAFRNLVEYIARNPERAGLISEDTFFNYPYSGSLVAGYPDLNILQNGGWDKYERIVSSLRKC